MTSLFLIERIAPHILPRRENREDVGRVLAQLGRAEEGDGGDFRQIGTWLLIGMTGRWPMCLALWELQRGWRTFADMVERTMHAPDPHLAEVYARMQNIRTGGHTMVLEAVPGCPSFAEATAAPGRGNLAVLEDAVVPAGSEAEYLAALHEHEVPRLAGHGTALLGLYSDATTEGHTIAVWQTTAESFAEARTQGPTDVWLALARKLRTSWRQELWTAAPTSRFHPATVAGAS